GAGRAGQQQRPNAEPETESHARILASRLGCVKRLRDRRELHLQAAWRLRMMPLSTMRVALIYPPTCDPTAPYLAVPMLTGFLRERGVEVLPVDANIEAYDALLRPEPLAALRDRLERRLEKLERRGSPHHLAQRAYLQLWRARGDGRAAPLGIAEARATFKDEAAFFDPERYDRAVATVEAALRLASAAHAPLDLSFSGYRTPFALTTPEEIAH